MRKISKNSYFFIFEVDFFKDCWWTVYETFWYRSCSSFYDLKKLQVQKHPSFGDISIQLYKEFGKIEIYQKNYIFLNYEEIFSENTFQLFNSSAITEKWKKLKFESLRSRKLTVRNYLNFEPSKFLRNRLIWALKVS